ncbi:replicative DNA helicase [Candidatus Microgenomates bacterium]|nr:MAG: replicative DNA helicase [Candidatus Microgenomates bacterium]
MIMANPRTPPHDDTAEQSVLGAILLDKDALIDVAEFLRPNHFYKDAHNVIFTAMLTLFEKHSPVDLVTLPAEIKKKSKIESIGGIEYLSQLMSVVPTAAHAEQYGRIIHDHFVKRQLISASAKITESAFTDDAEAHSLLDIAEQEIFAISQFSSRRDFIAIKEALAASFDRLDELHKRAGGLRGVPTGFHDLDNKLAGMQDSNLLILAARPGTGKTAFTLNMAQHIASSQKIPVGFFSLEMSKEELVDRLLVSQADIDAWRLKTGKLSDDDFTRLSEAMGELAEAPLFIDDTPGITVMELRTKARRLQMEHKVKLLIVDYLQLVNPGRKFEGRVQEVSFVSQNMKNIARELKIPVIAISQLSRAVEARGTREPQLSDLRESGAIEQDADVVMFLYRPDSQEGEKWTPTMLTKLLIAKHRNGPLGEIDLMFRGDRIKFYGMEKKKEEKAA